MNLPFNKIHHIHWSYGRLFFPLWKRRWLARFRAGWRVIKSGDFHNCTITRIY